MSNCYLNTTQPYFYSRLYIWYMEPLFVIANKIKSPDKSDSLHLHLKSFGYKCDYNQYKVLSVIMTLFPRVPMQF